MGPKKFDLHNGRKGAALAIRIAPLARRNELAGILDDGTVKVRLIHATGDQEINQALVEFLAGVLDVSPANIDVVAGESGNDKLVSILELDADTVHNRILAKMT